MKQSTLHNNYSDAPDKPLRLRRYVWALAFIWSICVFSSIGWNFYNQKQQILGIARTSARMAYEKDVLYRKWNIDLGGVYAKVTDTMLPNPYITTPDRDIQIASDKVMTLINPAFIAS